MTESDKIADRESVASARAWGSAPSFKPIKKQHYRGRVFKSGNSLAFRIPAGTKLTAGMEIDLTIEDGQFLSLEPVEQPRRKFNIAKVAGSAHDLEYIASEDRVFEDRPLSWGAGPDKDADPR